ncbi:MULTISPECIES: GerAB/ArcD/ProY family transporter [Lysinibacillus]|uniref:GerAB/ArcD/ProY family transporter n=1 Tax=Lysinibacillus TaxID=400634 RepID=UPI00214D1230|nr:MULTISPECIES: endospore germination permease [Lysinibacillus]UUV27389.1 endospore germination permease [Lysinibacillus sp. FN11]UYB45663.1 endospore germination permease [Lysinibacillus capsici]
MKKQLISSRQFTIIVTLYTVGTGILIIPASIASEVKQDAWIVATIGTLLSLFLIKLYIILSNKMENLSIVEVTEKFLGNIVGKFISLCFVLLTLLSSGELLYFIGNFLQTEVMPETPPVVFTILFNFIILFAVYQGIEVFARTLEILFPIFLFIFITFLFFVSPQIDIRNIQPIFEVSVPPLIYSVLHFMGLFSFPLIVLLMIFPSAINNLQTGKKGFYIGTLVGGFIITAFIALTILVLGVTNTSLRTFPSYTLAQKISIGDFLQRIEIIMAFMWMVTIFVRSFIYFYASLIGIGQMLKLKDHRPLILPLGMVSIGLSQVVHANIIHSDIYNQQTWPLAIGVFATLLPLILLLVARFRRLKIKNVEMNDSMDKA